MFSAQNGFPRGMVELFVLIFVVFSILLGSFNFPGYFQRGNPFHAEWGVIFLSVERLSTLSGA